MFLHIPPDRLTSFDIMAIEIKDWSKHYEKSDHKKCKDMTWVAIPIKFEGLKYRRIMKMKDGPQILGAWLVLLQLAAKMPVRGVFRDDGKDLSFDDLELMSDFPAKILENAISVLSSESIGWIQELSGSLRKNSANPPTTRQDNTIQYKGKIFSQPTLTEIKEYCLLRKNSVTPQKWLDHYTSNGWMVGKNKMKDWKAAVRTWETNSFTPQPPPEYRRPF